MEYYNYSSWSSYGYSETNNRAKKSNPIKQKKEIKPIILPKEVKHYDNDKIDLVMLYVDGSDPVWQKQYVDAGMGKINKESERYRSNDQLQYIFRSIEKKLPFINNVFLVVSGETQVPSWMDTNNVKIITHKQIIPEKLLPTFNSCTIEMFIHKIPNLSEKFIYMNDDMLFMNKCDKKDFFDGDKLCTKLKIGMLTSQKQTFRKQCINSMNMAFKSIKDKKHNKQSYNRYCAPHHIPVPMFKSNNEFIFNVNEDEIMKICSKKRTDKNVNQYVFTDAAYFKGITKDEMPSHDYIEYNGKRLSEIYKKIKTTKSKLFCINDTSYATDEFRKKVKQCLSEVYNVKSKYEK